MAKSTHCALCANGTAKERALVIEAQPLGRIARFPRREWYCARCETAYTDDEQAAENEAAEDEAKASTLARVAGRDLRFVRSAAKLTQAELERLLGTGRNTVARWETGQRPVPPYIAAMIRLIALQPTVLRDLARLSTAKTHVRRRGAA